MKNCDKYKNMMNEAADGMLNGKQLAEFNKHIESCKECADEFESLKSLILQVSALPELDLPGGFHERAMRRIKLEVNVNSRQRKSIFDRLPNFNFGGMAPAMTSAFACFILLGVMVSVLNSAGLSLATDMDNTDAGTGLISSAQPAPQAPAVAFAESVAAQAPESSATPLPATEALPRGGAAAPLADNSNANTGGASRIMPSDTVIIQAAGAAASSEAATSAGEKSVTEPESGSAEQVYSVSAYTGISAENVGLTTKTAIIRIEVEDARDAANLLRNTGWDIESSNVSGGWANFNLKVSGYDYEYVKTLVKDMGRVLSENEWASDITDATNDYAVGYESKTAEVERLYDLLEQAGSIEDILKLEKRITTVIGAQSNYKGDYTNNIDAGGHCHLQVEFVSKVKYEEYRPKSFSERLNGAFIASVNFTASMFENIVVAGSALLLPVLAIAVIIIIIRFLRKKFSERGSR